MTTRQVPESPLALRDALIVIFPGFEEECDVDDGEFADVLGAHTYHAILFDFVPFFTNPRATWSDSQLRALGNIVNAAVAQGGDVENAFSTAMLEALHPEGHAKALKPFLSPAARAGLRW